MKPPFFFNCSDQGQEPDWSRFDGIEVQGCITRQVGDATVTEPADDAPPQFWCVMGHLLEGGVEAITDVPDRWLAEQLAAMFRNVVILVALHENRGAK
jgi:hypothetical protein